MANQVECPVCEGRGQTNKCRTEYHFEKRENGKQYVTDKLGSGCLQCYGKGVIQNDEA